MAIIAKEIPQKPPVKSLPEPSVKARPTSDGGIELLVTFPAVEKADALQARTRFLFGLGKEIEIPFAVPRDENDPNAGDDQLMVNVSMFTRPEVDKTSSENGAAGSSEAEEEAGEA